jgi:hypothetical protein
VAVFAFPVLCSVGAAVLLGRLSEATDSAPATAVRWAVILSVSTVVLLATERLARRALPLALLLKWGMAFPGPVPSRLSLARRAATGDAARRTSPVRSASIGDDPMLAAEEILMAAAGLDAHHRTLRGHAERVRALADLIAIELRLSDDARDRLRWVALLHDAGQLVDPGDVVDDTGSPSDDAGEGHPLDGAELLAPLAPWLGSWADTLAEHHERFDGGGYPFGLAGRDISMGGRIVAVADSYDTMTCTRHGRAPLSTDEARNHLAAHAGRQFDPVVVWAFLAVPVARLHAVAPLTRFNSLRAGGLGPRLTRTADGLGRVGLATVAATACVIGLLAAQRSVTPTTPFDVSAGTQHSSAPGHGVPHRSSAGTAQPPSAAAAGPGNATSGVTGTSADRPGPGAKPSALLDDSGRRATGSSAGAGGRAGGGASSGGGRPGGTSGTTGGSGPTTTVATGSAPPVPTTTVGGASPTPTTTAPPAPPLPPGALTASSDCQALIALPEVTLSWTPSPSPSVTGYEIFRGPDIDAMSERATVSGRNSTSYTDTSLSLLDSTYWYRVEAISGGTHVGSNPVSVSTPALCLVIQGRTR